MIHPIQHLIGQTLRDQVGADTKDKELKNKADEIDATPMFNRAIFGDKTTIIIGNYNKVAIKDSADLVTELTRLYMESGGKITSETMTQLERIAELAEAGNANEARPLLFRVFDFANDSVKNMAWGVAGNYISKILGLG